MLLLTSTSDIIRVVTATGSSAVHCHASWIDNASGTITPGRTNTASITTATTTTIVAAPGASTQRAVKVLNIKNAHASAAETVTVQHFDGSTSEDLVKVTLAAGELLCLAETGVWMYYDATGKPYTGVGPVASQSEMETGTSTTVFVTPGRQHFHPGHPKCWGMTTVSGGTPTLQVSYNITSITDTATDQLTVTIATDFSGTSYAMSVSLEAATTSLSATTTSLACFIRNATLAAGSFIIQACEFDVGAATDPSSWHWIGCGDQA